ncbi:hypothetical protein RISK_000355 [Rhodopirellula islandica]|uniref:Uncharacterized protein n=1 Tax=Rhodopirellula islandica TaxID=595434 RepID=A0A0J1BL98_RHOIS|nr:hypothetical protein RISK_000355 [Rhodopirellula islandica]
MNESFKQVDRNLSILEPFQEALWCSQVQPGPTPKWLT